MRRMPAIAVATLLLGLSVGYAQGPPAAGPAPARVDVTPMRAESEVGQTLKFTAVGVDASGTRLDVAPAAWFAAPFDSAAADQQGNVTFFQPGEIRVGAIVGGKPGFAVVIVKPPSAARLEVLPPSGPIAVGAGVTLTTIARSANGTPLSGVPVVWTSDAPSVATVDAAGLVTGLAPGKTVVQARSGATSATVTVQVAANRVTALAIEPRSISVRTGDVVRFRATPSGADAGRATVRWSVSGEGAAIASDGAFVAEQAGSYAITATIGDRAAAASVVVSPRNVQRPLEVVGRTPAEEFQTLEQWVVGNYLYVTSAMAGRLWVYNISNPSAPLKVDSIAFDARILNDVSTTADGRVAVVTREGASNRKNGIVFLDTSDPAHPKIASEYTETVTGGVHSAFIDGHYVYLTDDATGSLRVIDFSDLKTPREVARWELEKADVRKFARP